MTGTILLGLLIIVPAFILFFLRSDAAIVFLALCTGSVVAKYVSSDATETLQTLVPKAGSVTYNYVQIGIILLPAVVTATILRQHASGTKVIINIFPAILTGVLFALLVAPLLPYGAKLLLDNDAFWKSLQQYQAVVIGAGALLSFLFLWRGHKRSRHGKHK